MNNLQNLFKRFHITTQGRLFGFGTSPEADWKIIFSFGTILVLVVIFLSVYLFLVSDNWKSPGAGNPYSQEGGVLNADLLRETVLYYENKALDFERIKLEKVEIPDPSI